MNRFVTKIHTSSYVLNLKSYFLLHPSFLTINIVLLNLGSGKKSLHILSYTHGDRLQVIYEREGFLLIITTQTWMLICVKKFICGKLIFLKTCGGWCLP